MDVNPNRRIKAAFSNSPGVLRTGPKANSTDKCCGLKMWLLRRGAHFKNEVFVCDRLLDSVVL